MGNDAKTTAKAPKTTQLRLVALIRVSSAGQLDGYGLEAQEKDVRRWAKMHEHKIVKVCRDEGVTGKADEDDRPGLREALMLIADGQADGILSPNLDRLARSMTQQEAILQVVWASGGRVFTADRGEHVADDGDDPMRTFVRQVMGAAAELERGLIAKRLKNGRAVKASKGGYAGGAPAFGKAAVNKELADVEDEGAVVAQMRQWRKAGSSYREIADLLNKRGVQGKRGGKWHPTTVARTLNETARAKDRELAAERLERRRTDAQRTRAGKVLNRVI